MIGEDGEYSVGWNQEKEDTLKEEFGFKEKRELAKELGVSEKQVGEKLNELGFRTLNDFEEEKDISSIDLSYEISEMERRKLQGMFGEKVAVFVKGKLERFLKSSIPDNWSLHQGVKLKTKGENHEKSLWFGRKNTMDKKIDISDSTVRHHNMEDEKIKEAIRKRHFYCSEDLFEKFQGHRIPSIDQVYYAVKKTGDRKAKDYHLVNSEASSFSSQRKKTIGIEEVEDFKVIGIEIKTTEDRAENLFSSLQRSIRDKSKNSAFLDLYSLKVEYEKDSNEIPQEVDLRLERLG